MYIAKKFIFLLKKLTFSPQVLSIIVFDPFTELFITLCIMVSILLIIIVGI